MLKPRQHPKLTKVSVRNKMLKWFVGRLYREKSFILCKTARLKNKNEHATVLLSTPNRCMKNKVDVH